MPSADLSKREVEKIADLIRDAGGEVIGRTRLQKIAFLLEITGLGEGFSFEYRHYGPYSAGLATAARKASLLGLIDETEKVASWGGYYSIYKVVHPSVGKVAKVRLELAKVAAEADPVELELAATAAFLSDETPAPWEETAKRKADKAANGRLEKAKSLYRKLFDIKTPKRLPNIA
jgi:uncharacterized protein YwgA